MRPDPHGVVEVTGMDTMPLEPDSPEPDPLSSEQWTTDGGSHLDILIDRQSWPQGEVVAARPALCRATDLACETFGWPRLEVGAMLCGDDRMRDLNKRFRGKDSPTNVLSFPSGDDGMEDDIERDGAVPETGVLTPGEIAIAYETLRREAKDEAKSLSDHLVHLWVHGLLHLMGHDHEAEAEAELMEAGEIRVLARLGIANPYAVQAGGSG